MDTEAFARDTAPRQRRSRLQRFKNDIRELKQRGYTDLQIRDWLAKNDVIVSRENVRKFIKRHLSVSSNSQEGLIPAGLVQNLGVHASTHRGCTTTNSDSGKTESQAEKLRRLAKEQRDQADQTQFKHDKTGNNH
ncbi:hypothetical protein ACI48D_08720 [Massilia sp. LXY-6]|uniref:hypothetical protein n=1 Tax=Massilia sp. LXY-6 TaxID=3379823 RepID=UPI003EE1996F